MREIRPSGSEGGARFIPRPYPYFSIILRMKALKSLRHSAERVSPVIVPLAADRAGEEPSPPNGTRTTSSKNQSLTCGLILL